MEGESEPQFRAKGIEAVRPAGKTADPATAVDAPYEHCPPIAARVYAELGRQEGTEKPKEGSYGSGGIDGGL